MLGYGDAAVPGLLVYGLVRASRARASARLSFPDYRFYT